MPKSASAQKAARSSERKRIRNRSIKSATKTQIAKMEKLIQNNDLEAAQKEIGKTISSLDKTAKKKVLHPNTVSRRKSRLMKKFNKVKPTSTAKTETPKAATKKKKG